MPAVTSVLETEREPIAITHFDLELAGVAKPGTTGRPLAWSILISARSVWRSAPMTFALNSPLVR